jgi:hypothetical protein
MQRTFLTLLILLTLFACRQRQSLNTQNNILTFKVFLYPSFDEKAQIVLTKIDTQQVIQFLLLDREFANKTIDTFYFKKAILTKEQFDSFNSLVIGKTQIKQPHQWTGCCDGMPVEYLLIQGIDTSNLHFRSPDIKSDSSGYQVTKAAIDQFRILFKDSVISDYLNDVESYMNENIKHINWKDNRQINTLRKIEYSR